MNLLYYYKKINFINSYFFFCFNKIKINWKNKKIIKTNNFLIFFYLLHISYSWNTFFNFPYYYYFEVYKWFFKYKIHKNIFYIFNIFSISQIKISLIIYFLKSHKFKNFYNDIFLWEFIQIFIFLIKYKDLEIFHQWWFFYFKKINFKNFKNHILLLYIIFKLLFLKLSYFFWLTGLIFSLKGNFGNQNNSKKKYLIFQLGHLNIIPNSVKIYFKEFQFNLYKGLICIKIIIFN